MAVPEQLSCTTDPDAYRSILENLLENAVKYSPAGSTIRVELEQNGSVAELRVADQGVGIPAEERERIFERFYRGGDEEVRRTKGTGLGLYIVRRLVERMGGNVRVESRPGSGSIFAIRLPLQ
jgi:two-component system phosphate regulon sensor histidine kinase PhoR